MADILDHQMYEVVNPQTGREEVWKGERIKAYEVNYRIKVQLPDLQEKAAVKPKKQKK